MIISNVIKEMDFILVEQKTRCDRVHWGITPAFVEETAITVQGVEEIKVGP